MELLRLEERRLLAADDWLFVAFVLVFVVEVVAGVAEVVASNAADELDLRLFDLRLVLVVLLALADMPVGSEWMACYYDCQD